MFEDRANALSRFLLFVEVSQDSQNNSEYKDYSIHYIHPLSQLRLTGDFKQQL